MAKDRLASGPRRILGLGMVAIVVAVLVLCGAVYNKVFTDSVPVTVQIDQVDNSFLPHAEVRMRGVTVGEVNSISTNGRFATLSLALQPSQVTHIPSNVTARLLPKSLFGERFLALEPPSKPTAQRIKAGDVITRDRSSSAVQIERVFTDLLPLLQAVRPADLANTLGALSQALSGRGGQLGDTVTQLHQYLSKLNPALPDLAADIRQVPKLTDTYSQAAPDLIEALKALTTTSKTLVDKQDQFAELYSTLTGTADDLRGFLRENRSNLINLASTARPTLELLAQYSPEYVCLFQRLAAAVPLAKAAFGEGTARPALHVKVVVTATRGKYLPHKDEPEFTDRRGPMCYDNTPPLQQYPGGPAMDGSTHPPAQGPGRLATALPGLPRPPSLPLLGGTGGSAPAAPSLPSPSSAGPLGLPLGQGGPVPAIVTGQASIANSAPERDLVAGLVAEMTNSEPSEIPAWSSVLAGPLFRGAEVNIR